MYNTYTLGGKVVWWAFAVSNFSAMYLRGQGVFIYLLPDDDLGIYMYCTIHYEVWPYV